MSWIWQTALGVCAFDQFRRRLLCARPDDDFDTRRRLRAQSFEALLDGALNPLFRGFTAVEGRSKAAAECLPAMSAVKDKGYFAAPKNVAAVIG
jgi:hypothetical protein